MITSSISPDFVIELRSSSDSPKNFEKKYRNILITACNQLGVSDRTQAALWAKQNLYLW
ncbi:MAG: Uma2 family endonuclease [Pleurocapsa minor HA4230-MV1]|nr:Uma2 family endonuclease [Pleurocapsa minor HA4230-MV1]